MKKILCTILALMMVVLCFGACAPGDKQTATDNNAASDAEEVTLADLDTIKANGKMVIGITEYEPMNYKDDAGEWTGFDTEFAEAVCKELGVEAEFVEIEWENKFVALESKAIDCIWNGMTISDEVLKNTSCSDAYVKNAQVVVVNKDAVDKYKDAASMADLTIAVEAGSAGATAAEENGLENIVEVGAQTDALLEVSSGSSDACIIDLTMANSMLGEGTSYADLAVSCELTSEEYGIGFRKGSDLTAEVNAIMTKLIDDGTLPSLAEKYELVLAADA